MRYTNLPRQKHSTFSDLRRDGGVKMGKKSSRWVEWAVVGVLLAAATAISYPGLKRGSSISENEVQAIASLRTLQIAEEQFRASIVIDQDTDGVGEYGTLQQLGGSAACPPTGHRVDPPFIDPELAQGEKQGYAFHLFVGSAACCSISCTFHATNASEISYFAYAVGTVYGVTGRRAFVVDASGVIRGSDFGGRTPCCSTACGEIPWPVVE